MTALLAVAFAALLVRRWHWPMVPVAGLAALVALLAVAFPQYPPLPFAAGTLRLALLAALQPDDDGGEWFRQSWGYAQLILPLLLGGVLVAGFLLSWPGHESLYEKSPPPLWGRGRLSGEIS